MMPPDLSIIDQIALAWFLAAWLGYGRLAPRLHPGGSIAGHMLGLRRAWMWVMLGRDNRITDAALIGHTVHSATFFASTTMVALAALLGVLGNLDRTYAAVQDLALTAKASRGLLEMKVALLVVVFAYGFLQFTWALRQLNYCIALIGGAPLKPDPALRSTVADHAATMLTLAMASFNAGIRGYYFALAGLAWLLGSLPFAAATSAMLGLLLWRQFGSAMAAAIRLHHQELSRQGMTGAATSARGPAHEPEAPPLNAIGALRP